MSISFNHQKLPVGSELQSAFLSTKQHSVQPLGYSVGETAAQYGLWLTNEMKHLASSDQAVLL